MSAPTVSNAEFTLGDYRSGIEGKHSHMMAGSRAVADVELRPYGNDRSACTHRSPSTRLVTFGLTCDGLTDLRPSAAVIGEGADKSRPDTSP